MKKIAIAAGALLATTCVHAIAQEMPAPRPAEGGYGLGAARPCPKRSPRGTSTSVQTVRGLPVGSGDVWTGEELYVTLCSSCHGDFGEAVGRWPMLSGGFGTLDAEDPVKTVGSYWPYISTVWDYVHRAMPYGAAQTLTDDEVYAITAYLLYLNNVVDDDFELSNETFAEVALTNEGGFFMDDRDDVEIPEFSARAVHERLRRKTSRSRCAPPFWT